jgi:demethoxyubiquinone hydroxylase (CLK1/Coq7/Cat5 family)
MKRKKATLSERLRKKRRRRSFFNPIIVIVCFVIGRKESNQIALLQIKYKELVHLNRTQFNACLYETNFSLCLIFICCSSGLYAQDL